MDTDRICPKCKKDVAILIVKGENKLIVCDCGAVTAVEGKEAIVVYQFKG